jgi:hypothetical protein
LRLSAARSIELEVVETVSYKTVPPSKERVESSSSTERDVEARPIPWDLAAGGARAEPPTKPPSLCPLAGAEPHVLVVSGDYSTKEDGAS